MQTTAKGDRERGGLFRSSPRHHSVSGPPLLDATMFAPIASMEDMPSDSKKDRDGITTTSSHNNNHNNHRDKIDVKDHGKYNRGTKRGRAKISPPQSDSSSSSSSPHSKSDATNNSNTNASVTMSSRGNTGSIGKKGSKRAVLTAAFPFKVSTFSPSVSTTASSTYSSSSDSAMTTSFAPQHSDGHRTNHKSNEETVEAHAAVLVALLEKAKKEEDGNRGAIDDGSKDRSRSGKKHSKKGHSKSAGKSRTMAERGLKRQRTFESDLQNIVNPSPLSPPTSGSQITAQSTPQYHSHLGGSASILELEEATITSSRSSPVPPHEGDVYTNSSDSDSSFIGSTVGSTIGDSAILRSGSSVPTRPNPKNAQKRAGQWIWVRDPRNPGAEDPTGNKKRTSLSLPPGPISLNAGAQPETVWASHRLSLPQSAHTAAEQMSIRDAPVFVPRELRRAASPVPLSPQWSTHRSTSWSQNGPSPPNNLIPPSHSPEYATPTPGGSSPQPTITSTPFPPLPAHYQIINPQPQLPPVLSTPNNERPLSPRGQNNRLSTHLPVRRPPLPPQQPQRQPLHLVPAPMPPNAPSQPMTRSALMQSARTVESLMEQIPTINRAMQRLQEDKANHEEQRQMLERETSAAIETVKRVYAEDNFALRPTLPKILSPPQSSSTLRPMVVDEETEDEAKPGTPEMLQRESEDSNVINGFELVKRSHKPVATHSPSSSFSAVARTPIHLPEQPAGTPTLPQTPRSEQRALVQLLQNVATNQTVLQERQEQMMEYQTTLAQQVSEVRNMCSDIMVIFQRLNLNSADQPLSPRSRDNK